jgi:hypothetical protein
MTLTQNAGFFDKGCPGERLITRAWFCWPIQGGALPSGLEWPQSHRVPRQSDPESIDRSGAPIASRAPLKCSLGARAPMWGFRQIG